MTLPRRRFLRLATAVAALPAVSRIARAQAYPTRPVRIIAPFPAGSTTDIVARLIGQWLSERLGQPLLIENRTGAGGNTATEAVLRSPPDGHTLLLVTAANAINVILYEKLNFNFVQDTAPVARVIATRFVLVVNPSLPATTAPEFIAYAKTNPGKLNMASSGIGSLPHLAGELFKMMTGIDMRHVPYRGSPPALTDLVGGQVQVYFGAISESLEHVRADKLRALAITNSTRWEALPDIPTVSEFLPGYEASGWLGVGVPKNTPAGIVDRLNKEINAGLADPKLSTGLADLGGTLLPGSPGDFGKLIADDTEKWGKVVRAAKSPSQDMLKDYKAFEA
jgi:tripartite-type tricarboxylate transporter receptor subunit TctC